MKKKVLIRTFYVLDETSKKLEEVCVDNVVCFLIIQQIVLLIQAIQSAIIIYLLVEIFVSLNLDEEDVRKLFEKTYSEKRLEKTDNSLEETMDDYSKVCKDYKKQEPDICQGKFPIATRAGHIRTIEN